MFKNEVKIDPRDMLEVIRKIEKETVIAVLQMIKQENNSTIPDYIISKIAARYNLPSAFI